METIHVAFCTDLGYLPHLATALQSLYEHNSSENICVHILSLGLGASDESRFDTISAAFDRQIAYIDVNIEEYR